MNIEICDSLVARDKAVIAPPAGIGVAQFGLVAIIAQGYNAMNWVFMLIFALPMVTLGIYKIAKATKKA